jgi:hypothetical protein
MNTIMMLYTLREITDMTVGLKAYVFVNVFKQQDGSMVSDDDKLLFKSI